MVSKLTLDYAIKYLRESSHDDYLDIMLSCDNGEGYETKEATRIAREKEQLYKWLRELREYKSLEKKKRLLKLPCKLKDVVDVIFSHNEVVTLICDRMCEDCVKRYLHIWHGMAWEIPKEYLEMRFLKVHGVVSDKPDTLYIEVCDSK